MLSDGNKCDNIHCFFGARNNYEAAKYEHHKLFMAMVKGKRRILLAHPNEKYNAYMYDNTHPLARHTMVDWARPILSSYPNFSEMKATEVILTAGEILCLPSLWLHAIQNLDTNTQCNLRCNVI